MPALVPDLPPAQLLWSMAPGRPLASTGPAWPSQPQSTQGAHKLGFPDPTGQLVHPRPPQPATRRHQHLRGLLTPCPAGPALTLQARATDSSRCLLAAVLRSTSMLAWARWDRKLAQAWGPGPMVELQTEVAGDCHPPQPAPMIPWDSGHRAKSRTCSRSRKVSTSLGTPSSVQRCVSAAAKSLDTHPERVLPQETGQDPHPPTSPSLCPQISLKEKCLWLSPIQVPGRPHTPAGSPQGSGGQ